MKNILQGAVLRAVCLLLLGVLLVVRSEEMPVWLIKAAGILFIIPGIVSVASLLRTDVSATAENRPGGRSLLLPFTGAAAIALGAIIFFMAESLVSLMMYVLSAVLIVAAALQCVELQSAARRGARIPPAAYAMPVLVLVTALVVVLDVKFAAAMPFIFIGAGCIVYGITELWAAVVIYLLGRRLAREAAAAAKSSEMESPQGEIGTQDGTRDETPDETQQP